MLGNCSVPSLVKYSPMYWYGKSQHRKTQWISPSPFRSSSNVPAALHFERNWQSPCKLNPDDGPHTRPSRESCMLRLYESCSPTSSTTSTASFQGNLTGVMSARLRGPGTRWPAAVQTATVFTLGLLRLKNVPMPVIVPDVPMPVHMTVISGSCFMICGPVHL